MSLECSQCERDVRLGCDCWSDPTPFTDYSAFAPKPKARFFMHNARLAINDVELDGFRSFVVEGSFDLEAFCKVDAFAEPEPRTDNAMTGVMEKIYLQMQPLGYGLIGPLFGQLYDEMTIVADVPQFALLEAGCGPIEMALRDLDAACAGRERIDWRVTAIPAVVKTWSELLWHVEAWYL